MSQFPSRRQSAGSGPPARLCRVHFQDASHQIQPKRLGLLTHQYLCAGHWNLHDMVIDMRGVTLTLTNPTSISYWDVESNLTIVGVTLWTNQELWTQGMVTAAVDNADGSVQVTVQTDSGYDSSIWCANSAEKLNHKSLLLFAC